MNPIAWFGLAVCLTAMIVPIVLFGWYGLLGVAAVCFIISALNYGGEFL